MNLIMDCTNRILLLSGISAVISTIVSSSYIPSTGGTIPQEMSPQEFNERQQQMLYNSTPFKVTMISLGIAVILFGTLGYRSSIIERRREVTYWRDRSVKPILKVSRSQVLNFEPKVVPIEILVEDPKPNVTTTPVIKSTTPPISSSPPIQLIPDSLTKMELRPFTGSRPLALAPPMPRGPVIHRLPYFPRGPLEVRRTFQYPPPYDVMNRK
jgi:hypothetical protein